ncbi:MAG: hypothetical protein U0174_28320 [Polyangiaceae bacterium]
MRKNFAFLAVVTTFSIACSSTAVKGTSDAGTGTDGGGATDAGGGNDLGSFTMECGTTTKDFTFDANKTELFRFDATWKTTNGDSVPEFVIVGPDGQEISVAGNSLGSSPGLLTTTPKTTTLVHDFFTAGKHTLRFRNTPPGCNPIVVTASYTRVKPAATNLTRETAMALTKGQATSTHQGCTERWYKLNATAGEEVNVVMTGNRYEGVATDIFVPFTMDLFDGTGSPVIVSGSGVTMTGPLGDNGSEVKLNFTAESTDTFFVKVSESGCIAAPATYSIKY